MASSEDFDPVPDPTDEFEAYVIRETPDDDAYRPKLIKYPVDRVYPVVTGVTFDSVSSDIIQYFEDYRDGKKEQVNPLDIEGWLERCDLSPRLQEYLSNPIPIRIDPEHDGTRFAPSRKPQPGPGAARNHFLAKASGKILVYGATQQDIAMLMSNLDVTKC